jgi:protein TonB
MSTIARHSKRAARRKALHSRLVPRAESVVRLPVTPPSVRVHAAIAILVSLLSHTAVLAAMAWVGGQGRVVWVAVQTGAASIDLTASMAAVPSKGEQDQRHPDPTKLERQEEDRRQEELPVLLAKADAAVTPVTRDAAQPAMPRAEPLAEAPEMLVRPRVMPALEQPVIHKQTAPSDKPDKTLQTMPHMRRADVGRRLAESLVPSTAESVPSPGSVASHGAQSDIPTIVSNPAPDYPADAMQARIEGQVVLYVMVDAQGSVIKATVRRSSGSAALDQAALTAVLQWRFDASESGKAVREIGVPVNFRIEDAQ